MSCLVTESCSGVNGSSTSRVVMYNAIHGAAVCLGDMIHQSELHSAPAGIVTCAVHSSLQVHHHLGTPAHLEVHKRLCLQCLIKCVIVCAVDSIRAMVFNTGCISLPGC